MALSDFHSLVRSILNRGTKYDEQIVAATRLAARFIEENYTLGYMKLNGFISLSTETYDFSTVVTPNQEVKAVHWLRLVETGDDGSESYTPLAKLDPMDWDSRGQEMDPEAYAEYRDGTNAHKIRFNAIPSAADPARIEFEISLFTNWPTDTAQTPKLLAIAEGVLLYQTLMQVHLMARDMQSAATYEPLFQQRIKTLLDTEYERENSGRDEVMAFV